MLILLYFEDYGGALLGTSAFAIISLAGTLYHIVRGKFIYYGLGFSLGAAALLLISIFRLEWCTRNLAYLLLGRRRVSDFSQKRIWTRSLNRNAGKERNQHG